jgi:hypothetical protein
MYFYGFYEFFGGGLGIKGILWGFGVLGGFLWFFRVKMEFYGRESEKNQSKSFRNCSKSLKIAHFPLKIPKNHSKSLIFLSKTHIFLSKTPQKHPFSYEIPIKNPPKKRTFGSPCACSSVRGTPSRINPSENSKIGSKMGFSSVFESKMGVFESFGGQKWGF